MIFDVKTSLMQLNKFLWLSFLEKRRYSSPCKCQDRLTSFTGKPRPTLVSLLILTFLSSINCVLSASLDENDIRMKDLLTKNKHSEAEIKDMAGHFIGNFIKLRIRKYPGKKVIGKVKYVGKISDNESTYFGVHVLLPWKGKNSGNMGGKQYFRCKAGQGIFVRPCAVKAMRPPTESDAPKTELKEQCGGYVRKRSPKPRKTQNSCGTNDVESAAVGSQIVNSETGKTERIQGRYYPYGKRYCRYNHVKPAGVITKGGGRYGPNNKGRGSCWGANTVCGRGRGRKIHDEAWFIRPDHPVHE